MTGAAICAILDFRMEVTLHCKVCGWWTAMPDPAENLQMAIDNMHVIADHSAAHKVEKMKEDTSESE
jgi:transcription elongation factor Elf1